MAQSKSFFGNRRGSTKSHTYQVNGGLQITKDRVDEVKNPRTSAQMVHRCCLHTLSDAHAYLRPFIGGFWEGARSPQAALAAFRKANYPIVRAAAESGDTSFSYSPYKETTKPYGLFQVSNGTLSGVHISIGMNNSHILNAYVTLNSGLGYDKTFSQVLSASGLKVGDIISVLFIGKFGSNNEQKPLFVSLRIKNAPNYAWSSLEFDEVYDILSIYNATGKNYSLLKSFLFGITIDNSRLRNGRDFLMAFCVIERKVNGKSVFSSSFMKKGSTVQVGTSFAEAIATYPQGGGNVLDGGPV